MAAAMKDTKLYLIGNAHIDPVWLWGWPEGHHEVRATFRSALDRLNEYDDFVFVASSAAFYAWIERGDPAMFAEIKQRVAEGRWEIVGGWWIQPDCNLPGGEAFVRQGLYGQHYFKEKFGVTARTGYCVDAFGHHAVLPQILRKSGLENYVFARPSPAELETPGRLFWWEAADGARVLAHRLVFGYNASVNLDAHVRRSAADITPPAPALMCFYGVGNHGGGPTRANIESLRAMQADPALPELAFSTPNAYFDDMRALNLPLAVFEGELQHNASGCYSAHSGVKQWNRQAEQRLLTAEKWATIATRVLEQPYPAADLAHAWKQVLFNQFHDILAGTSLESAYGDARDSYGEALAIGNRVLTEAVEALSWNIQLEADEAARPFVVFNHHAWASRCAVEVEFGAPPIGDDVLLDDAGEEIPYQIVLAESASNLRFRLAFVADLPPLGYATYTLRPRPAGQAAPLVAAPVATGGDTVLENEHLRVEFDPATGYILSLRDKRVEREVFSGPAARAAVLADPSNTWSHGVYRFDQEVGAFKATRTRLIENGPVRATLRVESAYGNSRLVQDFTLYRELDRLDVAVSVDWHERYQVLKLNFPANLDAPVATYEIPYGTITRPGTGQEEVGQTWVDLTSGAGEAAYGLSLLNDAKYSFAVSGSDLSLTVLRSPIYAALLSVPAGTEDDYRFMDQGLQAFHYSLWPHAGPWESGGTVMAAAELNAPALAAPATFHAGTLPRRAAFIEVESPDVTLTVVKQAEAGDDLILRAVNTSQRASYATIHLNAWRRAIQSEFGPAEIKTFRVPQSLAHGAVENNLLEWEA